MDLVKAIQIAEQECNKLRAELKEAQALIAGLEARVPSQIPPVPEVSRFHTIGVVDDEQDLLKIRAGLIAVAHKALDYANSAATLKGGVGERYEHDANTAGYAELAYRAIELAYFDVEFSCKRAASGDKACERHCWNEKTCLKILRLRTTEPPSPPNEVKEGAE